MNHTLKQTQTSKRLIDLIWIILVLFTLSSFVLAEGKLDQQILNIFVVSFGAIKAILIAAVFMELREASKGVLAFFTLFFITLAAGLIFLLLQ